MFSLPDDSIPKVLMISEMNNSPLVVAPPSALAQMINVAIRDRILHIASKILFISTQLSNDLASIMIITTLLFTIKGLTVT